MQRELSRPPSSAGLLVEHWDGYVGYNDGLERQEKAVAEVLAGGPERVFLLEHSPVLTVGTSGNAADVLDGGDIPVMETGRGGKVTWHGPGQRVGYVVCDLNRRGRDIKAHIKLLQDVIIKSLNPFGINAHTTDDVGVWVTTPRGEEKIAAIGVRVRRWVTFHGFALNVCPDLSVYQRFIPCGIADRGVTSMASLGFTGSIAEVDALLERELRAALEAKKSPLSV